MRGQYKVIFIQQIAANWIFNRPLETRRYCGIRIASVGRVSHPRRFGVGELNFASVSINL